MDRLTGTADFLRLVDFLMDRAGGAASDKGRKEEDRTTWYLDTRTHEFRRAGFILRVRREISKSGDPKYKLTLKHRNRDRYLAGAPTKIVRGEDRKFEQDIVPPFRGVYSLSASEKTKADLTLKRVKDVAAFFPHIADIGIDGGTKLHVVSGFKAAEIADKARIFLFGDDEVKACVSFWYFDQAREGAPLIVEFSFDYDALKPKEFGEAVLEEFPRNAVVASRTVFEALQRQSGWVNRDATTKTAYAYGGL